MNTEKNWLMDSLRNTTLHFDDPENAILREKQIKGGSRQKKIDLIVSVNRGWVDLYDRI